MNPRAENSPLHGDCHGPPANEAGPAKGDDHDEFFYNFASQQRVWAEPAVGARLLQRAAHC